jgi:hypothetical protein
MVCLGSLDPKIAVPATNTFEPSRQTQIPHMKTSGRTGFSTLTGITAAHTPINLNVLVWESLSQFLNFCETLGHEFLTSPSWMDSHDQ